MLPHTPLVLYLECRNCWCRVHTSRVALCDDETVLVSLLCLCDEVLLVLVLSVSGLDVLLCLQCPAVENAVSDTTNEGRVADHLCVATRVFE